MNSTTAYIVVCMLLLSALVSLIVLLITVSERPNWLLADDPPRVYIDFDKFQEMQQKNVKQSKTTTATMVTEWSFREATTVATLPTFPHLDHNRSENLPATILLTINDSERAPSAKTNTNTLTTLVSDFSLSVISSVTTEEYNSSGNISNVTKQEAFQEVVPKTVTLPKINSEVKQQTTPLPIQNFTHFESVAETVEINEISDKSTSMLSSLKFTVATLIPPIINREIVMLEEISSNSRIENVRSETFKIISDEVTSDKSSITMAQKEFSTMSKSDGTVVLTLEQPESTTAISSLVYAKQRHGVSADNISDSLTSSIAVTKLPRMLATAVIRNIEQSNALLGGVRKLPNEFFGRERRVEQVTMKKVFVGRESSPTGNNEMTSISTLSSAKPDKYLSILMDYDYDEQNMTGVTLYLPKNNGEITVTHWDEKMRVLTTLETIHTELRRIHRVKLIPLRHQRTNIIEDDQGAVNVSSLTPRFVAVDGDRLKLVLLNERGEILAPRNVEIPSQVGVKDLCVDNGRIYVLSRQVLNSSGEIFVYDVHQLIFQRRNTFHTPFGENCNFIEAHGDFVYVACQSAILRIDMENASAPPYKFNAFDGSYSLAILPLHGHLLAAQRGRAEFHLFDAEARFIRRLVDVSADHSVPLTIFTSLVVIRRAPLHSSNSTILALEYITNLIHAYTIDIDI